VFRQIDVHTTKSLIVLPCSLTMNHIEETGYGVRHYKRQPSEHVSRCQVWLLVLLMPPKEVMPKFSYWSLTAYVRTILEAAGSWC
jgi:hypothetical protein